MESSASTENQWISSPHLEATTATNVCVYVCVYKFWTTSPCISIPPLVGPSMKRSPMENSCTARWAVLTLHARSKEELCRWMINSPLQNKDLLFSCGITVKVESQKGKERSVKRMLRIIMKINRELKQEQNLCLSTDYFVQHKMSTVAVHRSQKRKIIAISVRKTLMIQGTLKIVSKNNENMIIWIKSMPEV